MALPEQTKYLTMGAGVHGLSIAYPLAIGHREMRDIGDITLADNSDSIDSAR
ncbi:MAG: hypothetical protein L0338_11120 [Acidobacteria bacterium]|nr:hypothetical protein [Acidobacteriota bacterium]